MARSSHLSELSLHMQRGFGQFISGREAPAVRSVLLSQGRSGSSLLRDLLQSHPDIHFDNEIFARRVAGRLVSPSLYIDSRSRLFGLPAYGCKVKVYQLTDHRGVSDPEDFLKDLEERGWHFIHLTPIRSPMG